MLQLKDGRDKVVLNRDDAAGFRLDTTYIHKQHKILADAEQPELTTRTEQICQQICFSSTDNIVFVHGNRKHS